MSLFGVIGRNEQEPGPEVVPLYRAVLCADCELITQATKDSCGVCGSRALLDLSRTLGGCLRTESIGEPTCDRH
jgi:hypothetical protein